MIRRLLLISLFCVSGFAIAQEDLDGPPELGFRGTWTETREDMPDVILVHRNGRVMEITRVPGTGTNGIPLQLIGPSEISMKWAGEPMPWPPEINVLAEEPQYGDVIRVQVAGDAEVAAAVLMAMPEVRFAYPVEFTNPMFARILPTDQIIARLEAGVSIDQIEVPFGLTMIEPMLDSDVEFVFQLADPKSVSPGDVVDALNSSGLVEWAQVNCIREAEFYYTPADPQYGNQWHLNAAGQVIGPLTAPMDIDVNAPSAWNTTRGSSTIKVAVIDDAIETNHVDLAANISSVGAYDFYNNDFDPSPDSSNDLHGTACAGVVGAVEGNTQGIVGMAHQSPIVPIKICSNGVFPNDAQVANSVRHGAQYADIITCSWGYVNPAPSTLSSVRYALQSGAGGRGSVVFFATGNDGGFIPHMATLGQPGTYTLRWRYTKDATISSGLDRCFVDTVWYPDGSQEMFDALALPNLPAGMTSGGIGAWSSLAQFAGGRAESGTQYIGSPNTLADNQSSYAQVAKGVTTTNAPMWYYMRVDAQPTTYVGNTATVYDYAQLEYQRNGGSWTTANVQGGAPQTLSYPANDPETIAVGASDVTGRRSHYSQWDVNGALDFVAPSDGAWATLGIETTDLMGTNGYSSGNYCLAGYGSKFGGTSSATPLAAGIGALVRSANSSLSSSQVRNILRASCRKLDPTWYSYSGILGGRNQHVGWGQVNASNAVALALNTIPISLMANDLKITEVSPQDMNCPFVEIYNSSKMNAYPLDTVMLTDCATGGDQSESSYLFAQGSAIPPQGTIVVALGSATPPFIAELQALIVGGGVMPGGLQLFECTPSGLIFGGGPIGVMVPQIPTAGITLAPSDNVALVITPGMQASYLPDLIDGMSFGTPLPLGGNVIGTGPGIPEAMPLAATVTPSLSYQRTGAVDMNSSQLDFSVQSRTPGWIAFGSPVQKFAAVPLTSTVIDLQVTPALPGDMIMIVQSVDPVFDYPVHTTPYPQGMPFGISGDIVVYNGPVAPPPPGMPTILDMPPFSPVYYRAWTVDPMMMYSAGTDSMGSTLAPPMSLPFNDTFVSNSLDTVLWPYAPGVSVDSGVLAMGPPSPMNCAQLDFSTGEDVELASAGIDATTTPNVKLTYFWQEAGAGDPPDPGDVLRVEVLDPGMTWVMLREHPAMGAPMPFQPEEIIIDPGMLHNEFRVRFVSAGVSTGPADLDHWFVDDVQLAEYPVLSGFQWQPIPAKVSAGVPFDVHLTALSSMGGVLSNYMDNALLGLYETNGTPLDTLSPEDASPFVQGVWTNSPLLIDTEAASPVYLVASFDAISGTSTVFEVLEDVDMDDMSDRWEFQWFGGIGVATNTASSDQDGDKYPDHSEFVAGTLPLDSNSFLNVELSYGSSSNVMTWDSASNRFYDVESSSNLMSGFTLVVSNLVATPPTNTYPVVTVSNAPAAFYRLKVKK